MVVEVVGLIWRILTGGEPYREPDALVMQSWSDQTGSSPRAATAGDGAEADAVEVIVEQMLKPAPCQSKRKATMRSRKPMWPRKPRLPHRVTPSRRIAQRTRRNLPRQTGFPSRAKAQAIFEWPKNNPGIGLDRRLQTYPVTTFANDHNAVL